MASEGTVPAGDSLEINVSVTDSVTGAVVNLTGGTAEYRIARTPASASLLTKTSTAGAITFGGTATHVATVVINAGETDGFSGDYYHELVVWDSLGQESTRGGTVTFTRTHIQ